MWGGREERKSTVFDFSGFVPISSPLLRFLGASVGLCMCECWQVKLGRGREGGGE